MKERPIIFSGEMVCAILDGRKNQTRRVITLIDFMKSETKGYDWEFRRKDLVWNSVSTELLIDRYCKYGKPGDRLWVKETFVIESNHGFGNDYRPPHNDGRPIRYVHGDGDEYWEQPHYRATDKTPELYYEDLEDPGCKWKPSIYMPRWASRITLEVKNIRVERVQDITLDDIDYEGIYEVYDYQNCSNDAAHNRQRWTDLWNSINEKRGYGWDKNPWVWVIEFERVK